MPRNPHLCKTLLECRRCGRQTLVCLRLKFGAPAGLQCDHDHTPGGGGAMRCPNCDLRWGFDLAAVVAMVEELIHRRLKEWRKVGAVVVPVS